MLFLYVKSNVIASNKDGGYTYQKLLWKTAIQIYKDIYVILTNQAQYSTMQEANADPGVHSHLNLSGYLTPVGTTLALPTIQETQGNTPPDQEAPIAATDAEEVSPTTPPATEQDSKCGLGKKDIFLDDHSFL